MTTTIWNSSVSGDFNDDANWNHGAPTSSLDAIVNSAGAYTIAVDTPDAAQSLIFDAANATLLENGGGALTLANGLTVDSGTVILETANSFGAPTQIFGGVLEIGNNALGNSVLEIHGGTVVGLGTGELKNTIDADGSFTLAEEDGSSRRLVGSLNLDMNSGGTITFGQTGDAGILVWNPLTSSLTNSGLGFAVNVVAGTLRDGNGHLNEILSAATSTTIAAGAKIDLSGHAETINDLQGAGAIGSGKAGAALTLNGGSFAGTIKGAFGLTVEGDLTLSGANKYQGGTTIEAGGSLTLSQAGSVRGNIVDDGQLIVEDSKPLHKISGTGSVTISNTSAAMHGINTYSGGTTILDASLQIAGAASLGTGGVSFEDLWGTLISTKTTTLTNALTVNSGTASFLAADGTTLHLNSTAAYDLVSVPHLVFGSSTYDGTIVWDTPSGSTGRAHIVVVKGGTLIAGDSNFQSFIGLSSIDINSGATFDVAGVTMAITHLQGGGTLENSGSAETVTLNKNYFSGTLESDSVHTTFLLNGGQFSGSVVGNVTLNVEGPLAQLSGNAANWGDINVFSGTDLLLNGPSSGTFNLAANLEVRLEDPTDFSGTFAGFQTHDGLFLPIDGNGATLGYIGDTTGGTLTVTSTSGTFNIHFAGDYTLDNFYMTSNGVNSTIDFIPAAASIPYVFDFSAAPVHQHIAVASEIHPQAHTFGGVHSPAHDALNAHAHIDALGHDFFAHVHSVFAEALS